MNVIMLAADPAPAHPGNTDSSGCHTCRTNCTERWGVPYGDYHCHNGGSSGGGGGGGGGGFSPAAAAPPPPPPPDLTPPLPPTINFATIALGTLNVKAATEPGALVRVYLDSEQIPAFETTAPGPEVDLTFPFPDGVHTITIYAIDAAGNASAASAPMRIDNTAPSTPVMSWRRVDGRHYRLTISARGGTSVAVNEINGRLTSQQLPVDPTSGRAFIDYPETADGVYSLRAIAIAANGRSSPEASADVTVDTQAPDLRVAVNKKAARNGVLRFKVITEPEASIRVKSKERKLRDFTGNDRDGIAKLRFDLDDDERYVFVVVVKDDAGNSSRERVSVKLT